jgi:Glyoxalase-like domain
VKPLSTLPVVVGEYGAVNKSRTPFSAQIRSKTAAEPPSDATVTDLTTDRQTIMTRTTVVGISIDAHDAAKVAQFWAAMLGRQLANSADTHDAVALPSDLVSAGPRLAFHQVPEGKIVKNRVHLDLATNDIDGETARRSLRTSRGGSSGSVRDR